MSELWIRIRDHKVLQWGLAYLGAALAIAHGGELLGHAFNWPELIDRLLMGALIVGLPIALALAWYHGHRSLTSISAGEATIISLLVVIGGGLLMALVRVPDEGVHAGRAKTSVAPAGAANSTATSKPVGTSQGPSIAVLPFVNMSSDPEQDYFSDGLAEEVLNQLAHVPALRVIGRTSSFAFKGKNEDLRTIGQALGVDHILEGSVRKSGNRIRITAQLIDPSNGSHLWSDTYDRELGDVFAIQEGIARTVASNLRLTIDNDLGEVNTHNVDAYDEYLRARGPGLGPGDFLLETIAHLERAVQLDPQFTGAWIALVGAYNGALVNLPERTAEWVPKQDLALKRAVELAPQSAAVKMTLANREMSAGDLVRVEELLSSIKELPPGLAMDGYIQYAMFLMDVGRPTEAIEILKRVRQSEPVATLPAVMLQIAYESIGDYDAADQEYQRAQGVVAGSGIQDGTAVVRAMTRRDPQAIVRAVAAAGNTDPSDINQAMVRHIHDSKAALTELRRIFNDPGFRPSTLRSVVVAQWAGYFGDPDLSLRALRTMPRVGAGGPASSILFSLWRPLEREARRLPGFKDFVAELGLVRYWRATGKWGQFCRPLGREDFECR